MSDKIKNIVVAALFITTIVSILILNILKKDTEISETERRKLAQFPKFTVQKLLNGSFASGFDKYTTDQFIKRDDLRKLKTDIELNILRKKDVNNVYLYDGIIVKQEYPLNEKSVLNLTKKINEIQINYLNETNNVYYSIVPDKNYYVDNEYLKMDYSKLEKIMNDNLKNIEYINIFDCLNLNDYYATDTHWKQENLNKVLERISTRMNFKERLQTNLQEIEISNFNGVYSGQLQVYAKEDKIKILTNNIIEGSTVDNFETKKQTKIYDFDKLNGLDKYDIYLSGATPLLTITNPNSKTEKELIIFRDSFGSSLIPLFAEGYKTITIIDTRYIASKLLGDYVNFEGKDVLFIYSTLVINSSSTLK